MGVFYQNGTFNTEIMDIAFDEDDSGKATIVIRIKVLQELDRTTGDWVPCAQQYDRTIWLHVPEEEEYKKYVIMKLRQAGWKGSSFESVQKELLAQNCQATNTIRIAKNGKYAGQEVEGWDLPLPERESKPLENKPHVAKKLNALFGKVLKEDKVAAQPRVPTEKELAAVPPTDQDCPF